MRSRQKSSIFLGFTFGFCLGFFAFVVSKRDGTFEIRRDTTVSDVLQKNVKILCWILTMPKNHEAKAKFVKDTWGRRCSKLVFVSTRPDEYLQPLVLDMEEGEKSLWNKTQKAFKYIYENYFEDFDWFLKADDDTYVVVENLRYFLNSQNTKDPVYFGCNYKTFVRQGYMSGGGGYVLSKEALRRFGKDFEHKQTPCSREMKAYDEDISMGQCMEYLGVKPGDSRDSLGKLRFFPLNAEYFLIPTIMRPDFWFWNYTAFNVTSGMNCCSQVAVSFHYIEPDEMYFFEYLLYGTRPLGLLVIRNSNK